MSSAIGGTGVLFVDNFSGTGRIDSSKWKYNLYADGGSFYGNTQQRQVLPSASNGALQLALDTFNPTGDKSKPTFLGSEAITKQLFDLKGGAIAFEAKVRYAQDQRGLIGGFFTFAGPAASHDEIDFEALSNQPTSIQTNIYHNEILYEGHPQSFPVSGSLKDFHTYRIEWLPDAVRWLIDDKLVRTETKLVPNKPMAMHLNIWGPPSDWGTGDASLKAVATASENKSYFFEVASVRVETLSHEMGTTGHDRMSATSMNDWYAGGAGNDRLLGRAGDDRLHGGAGTDRLEGGSGADTLMGGAQNDTLIGENGNDVLNGGAGNDFLKGGQGGDRLTGGSGADAFVFSSVRDSSLGLLDTISDFKSAQRDVIDLSRMDANLLVAGNQSFVFLGMQPFTGNAGGTGNHGEARYEAVANGILVSLDVNRDQVSDVQFFVAKALSLAASDFVL